MTKLGLVVMRSKALKAIGLNMTPDDYLLEAWRRGAPNSNRSRGFPNGFWPDVARAAVELALAGDLTAPTSFDQSQCTQGDWPDPLAKTVKGIDLGKLEFNL